ncbi:MAG: putative serine esterase [Pseudobdellovibrio sp.]|jgi:phospholipase/carboxylesterase|nr:putative serine esterase [Pseudobdellovibrio sp.]
MRQAGPLQAIEQYNDPDAKWVILFHGFGADANDLAGLVDFFQFKKPCNWLFPNGPLSVDIGGGWTGRAWWTIKMSELEGDWTERRPPELNSQREKVFKMMSSMKFEWKNVILGGFSQGAMLATEVFLEAPETPAGLICLSGTLLTKAEWSKAIEKRKGSHVFISHGEADQVLPHKGSIKLQQFFEENGLKTQFVSFRGAHEIPMQVIEKMKSYIAERL